MGEAAAERGDQALRQYVKGGRTLSDVGTELAYLRREQGLSQEDLAQRAGLRRRPCGCWSPACGCRPARSSRGWLSAWD
jgi:hypothetical protein